MAAHGIPLPSPSPLLLPPPRSSLVQRLVVALMPPPLILSTLPPPLNAQPRPIEAPLHLVHWCLLSFASRLPAGCRIACCRVLPPCVTFCRAAAARIHPRPLLFVHASWLSRRISSHRLSPLNVPVPSPALLNARLQCGRPRVGRRRRRPSNDDALPPAPHRCTDTPGPDNAALP